MDFKEQSARAARLGEEQTAQALAFSRAASKTFERLARQNYALMGDVVDYTLSQLRVPTTHTDPKTMFDQHSANMRTLAEQTRVRAGEYTEIASELQQLALRPSAAKASRAAESKGTKATATKPKAAPATTSAADADAPSTPDVTPKAEAAAKAPTQPAASKTAEKPQSTAGGKPAAAARTSRAASTTAKSSKPTAKRATAKKSATASKASTTKRTPAKKRG